MLFTIKNSKILTKLKAVAAFAATAYLIYILKSVFIHGERVRKFAACPAVKIHERL